MPLALGRAAEVGAARRVVRQPFVPPAMHAVRAPWSSLPPPADAAQAGRRPLLRRFCSLPPPSRLRRHAPPLALYWPPDLLLLAVDGIHQTSGCRGGRRSLRARSSRARRCCRWRSTARSCRCACWSMRAAVDLLQKRLSAGDPRAADELAQLYSQHGVSPSHAAAARDPAALFTSFFFGLRRLADHFPAAHGGYLWVTDLGTADPTYVLPLATTSSALALVVLSVSPLAAGATREELQRQRRLRLLLGGATLVGLPIACSMPAAVITFWATNNAFSLSRISAPSASAPSRTCSACMPRRESICRTAATILMSARARSRALGSRRPAAVGRSRARESAPRPAAHGGVARGDGLHARRGRQAGRGGRAAAPMRRAVRGGRRRPRAPHARGAAQAGGDSRANSPARRGPGRSSDAGRERGQVQQVRVYTVYSAILPTSDSWSL